MNILLPIRMQGRDYGMVKYGRKSHYCQFRDEESEKDSKQKDLPSRHGQGQYSHRYPASNERRDFEDKAH